MIILFVLKYWRYFAIVGALAVIGWWHQHAVAVAYRQGATDRERSALQEAAMKVELDTIEQRKVLADRKTALDVQQAGIAGERAALNSARAGIASAFSASLNQIQTQNLDIKNEIQDLPDDAVNARFRLALQRARDSERGRISAGTIIFNGGDGTIRSGQ